MVIALFTGILALSQVAYAADATRFTNSDTVSYENRTYTRINKQAFSSSEKTKNLPISNYDGYKYEDVDKIYLILTDGDAKTASQGQAVSYSLRGGVYDAGTQSTPTTITLTDKADDPAATEQEGCQIEGVGWFVCPIMNLLADFMDGILDLMKTFLTVRTLQTDTNNNPIYEIWQKVRDLSNICFIIVFLIIVYSQITNLGLSNHHLKLMLPRLIIGAILVNVSFWVAGALVDISNVLGIGVQQFFTDVREGLTGYSEMGDDLSWRSVTTTVLAGGGAIGAVVIANGGIAATMTLLVPTLVGVLLAAIVAIVILAARQALITLCIVVAPLAFVGYVLPSTNKYFDKWKDLFLTMLLMFPIISFVFGAAQLAGYAIIVNAGDSLIQIIIGMAVQVAPIAITPLILKFSGGVLGRIGGIINNPSRGLLDRTRNWAQDRANLQAAKVRSGQKLINTDRSIFGKSDKLKRAAEGVNKAHGSRANLINTAVRSQHRRTQRRKGLTAAYEAAAGNDASEWDNTRYGANSVQALEGVNAARKSEIGNAFFATNHGQAIEARTRRAAIHKTELDNTFDRSHKDLIYRQQMADIDKTRVQNEFNETTDGRKVDVARRTVERQKQIIEQSLEHNWHTLNLRDSASQQAEMTLRVRADQTAAQKLKVDAIYDELKANVDGKEIIGSRMTAAVEAQLKQQAYDASLLATALGSRKAEAERILNTTINSDLVSNGKTYQKNASGEIVVDSSGQPVVLHQKLVDNTEVQKLATGVGSKNMMLARETAKQEKIEDVEADAAFALQKHFNFEASDFLNLATNKNASITRSDSSGNVMTFTFDDIDSRVAAATWIAENGSYGQKEALAFSAGNPELNAKMSGYISRILAKNGFGRQALWFNDLSINEVGQARISNIEDAMFHTFREIIEGRANAEKIATNNDKVFAYMHKLFANRAEGGEDWLRIVQRYADYMRSMGKSDDQVNTFLDNPEMPFDARYGDIIAEQERIETDPILRKMATGQVHKQIRTGLIDYSASAQGQTELKYRKSVEEASARIKAGNGTQADVDLVKESQSRYII